MAAIAAGAIQPQQQQRESPAKLKESKQRLSSDDITSAGHQDATPVVAASPKSLIDKPTINDLNNNNSSSSNSNDNNNNSSNSNGKSNCKTKSKTKVKEEKKQMKKSANNKKKDNSKAKKSNNNNNQDEQEHVQVPTTHAAPKAKTLVEELKLFQNNHLLNQQDPLQQLHIQLNALIKDESVVTSSDKTQSSQTKPFSHEREAANRQRQQLLQYKAECLSAAPAQQKQFQLSLANDQINLNAASSLPGNMIDSTTIESYAEANENLSTVKKGILWQQQNFEKFHQRLFSRWKKRYFILTTDYLVCFKRTSSKVGRSEMGKFLYKTSLCDVTKIDWLKPLKSDKGAIILHLNGPFNLFLWSKDSLQEWMFLLKESIERNKIRRSACATQNGSNHQQPQQPHQDVNEDNFYSNIAALQEDNLIHLKVNHHLNFQQPQDLLPKSANNDDKNLTDKEKRSLEKSIKKADKTGKETEPVETSTRNASQSQALLSNADNKSKERSVSASSSESENSRSMERYKATAADNSGYERRREKPERQDDEQVSAQGSEMEALEATINHLSNNDQPASNSESKSSRQSNGRDASSSSASSSSRGSSKRLANITAGVSKVVATNSPKDDSRRKGSNASKASKGSQNRGRIREDNATSTDKAGLCNNNGKLAGDDCETTTTASQLDDNVTDRSVSSQRDNFRKHHQRAPNNNLIRRDDSWQSLISLTRIGKVTPSELQGIKAQGSFDNSNEYSNEISLRSRDNKHSVRQTKPNPLTPISVAQRSLYARHIMPESANEPTSAISPHSNLYNRQYMINIESSITPSRAAPFQRQASAVSSQRRLRPLAQHAASFDVVPGYAPTSNQQQQQIQLGPNASYQQKLLQLQLLHNSNNVDYIRASNGAGNQQQLDGEQQQPIYGPDSASNYYGYSSMRSNLKSATSEFSFIRPSSSHANHQSTLPHPSSSFMLNNNNNNITNDQQKALERSLIVAGKGSDNNNNNYLSPETKQQQQQQQQLQLTNHLSSPAGRLLAMNQVQTGMLDLDRPPMRELPLKPSKRRTLQDEDQFIPKSSSLTSSIACFFRRAFSKRSKKGSKRAYQQSKLAESCSSSLGPLDDAAHLSIVPSAFSTGSKSLAGKKNREQQQQVEQKLAQSQRMVDMIEAFANKTLLNEANGDQQSSSHAPSRLNGLPSSQQQQRDLKGFKKSQPLPQPPQLRPHATHFGGSPLHKSNSISATMGLSLADINNRRSLLFESNEMRTAQTASGGTLSNESPLITRSSKVMSANLTPLLAQRTDYVGDYTGNEQSSHFFLSPRNMRNDQTARPSSIYGQPSMISSPVINGSRIEFERNNNFGVHRNSLHNHHFQNQSSGFDIRRQPVLRQPFLDSTKEVAEELASPTTCEPRSLDFNLTHFKSRVSSSPSSSSRGHFKGSPHFVREDFDKISASPSSGRLQPIQSLESRNHAIVNPILQSSTMNTIYDNHPMLNGSDINPYSHYDNHNQFLVETQVHRQSPSMRSSKTSGSMSHYLPPEPSDNPYTSFRALQQPQQRSSMTPSRSRAFDMERSTVNDMLAANQKPSAIVVPSTPDHIQTSSSPVIGRNSSINHGQQPIQQRQQQKHSRNSPLMSRRSTANQSHYQQSPLVSLETRVLNRGDGVQATIIGTDRDRDSSDYRRMMLQPVINIAGAPGINLEPALAASLLRGTNINAYETATYDDLASDSSRSDSKTFLVSTRLSKSMAYGKSSNSNGSSSSETKEDLADGLHDRASLLKSSRDELSYSGSKSENFHSQVLD